MVVNNFILLEKCSCGIQRDTFIVLLTQEWTDLGLTKLLETLNRTYFNPLYRNFHYAASGYPGVKPVVSPVDSYHRKMVGNFGFKETKMQWSEV